MHCFENWNLDQFRFCKHYVHFFELHFSSCKSTFYTVAQAVSSLQVGHVIEVSMSSVFSGSGWTSPRPLPLCTSFIILSDVRLLENISGFRWVWPSKGRGSKGTMMHTSGSHLCPECTVIFHRFLCTTSDWTFYSSSSTPPNPQLSSNVLQNHKGREERRVKLLASTGGLHHWICTDPVLVDIVLSVQL